MNAKDDVVEWTPLLHAAEGGHKEIIELLIAKGADVNAKNLRGETSLYDVVGRGHKEIAELLIAAGADVNAKDNDGSTPLHNAAKHDEVVELLIAAGADVNAKNTLGWTPLDRAITSNLTETADLLRKHGGKTGADISIHKAAEEGNIEAVKRHLAAGVDVNAKDKYEWTEVIEYEKLFGVAPLQHAAYWGRKEIAELLIAKGADINAKNDNGDTALDSARKESRQHTPLVEAAKQEIADLLRKHGGKTKKELEAEGK